MATNVTTAPILTVDARLERAENAIATICDALTDLLDEADGWDHTVAELRAIAVELDPAPDDDEQEEA